MVTPPIIPITQGTPVYVVNQSQDSYLRWSYFDDGLGSAYYTLTWGTTVTDDPSVPSGTEFFMYSVSTEYNASYKRHVTVITDPRVGCTETYIYPARDGIKDAPQLRTLVAQQSIPRAAFTPPTDQDVPTGTVVLAYHSGICDGTVPPGVFRVANWFISAT